MKGEVPMGEEFKKVRPTPPKETMMKMKVKDVMNPRPITVTSDTSIESMIERLRQQIEDCFPVVNKNRKLVGIITESDLLDVLYIPTHRATVGSTLVREAMKRVARNVGEIMTKRPITVTPKMTIQETLNIMATHKLRHLPVVEGEKLVGLINLRDILFLYRLIR
jgi:CBS domain-containing protein